MSKAVSNFRQKGSRMHHGARQVSDICNGKLLFDAPYQRDDVWGAEDKTKLIDSMFARNDIGSVVLAETKFEDYQKHGCNFEVVDGRQRLSTIQEFMQDKFEYRGYKYSEMSKPDQREFNQSLLRVGILPENATPKEKAQAFLFVNDTGVRQSPEHLERVRSMVKKMR